METISALLILCEGNPPVTDHGSLMLSLLSFWIWTSCWTKGRFVGNLWRHDPHVTSRRRHSHFDKLRLFVCAVEGDEVGSGQGAGQVRIEVAMAIYGNEVTSVADPRPALGAMGLVEHGWGRATQSMSTLRPASLVTKKTPCYWSTDSQDV